MSDREPVYDLGEIRDETRVGRGPSPSTEAVVSRPPTRETSRRLPTPPRPAPTLVPTSLSILVPGSGHLLQGRYGAGAAWMAVSLSLVGALAGAWRLLPRLWAAAEVLGLPPEASVWLLGAFAVALVAVHETSVLSVRSYEGAGAHDGVHPALASAASSLIPGWGQLLNGDLVRGGSFLLGAWATAAAWVLASAPVQEMLVAYRLFLPEPLATMSGVAVRWALPAGVWPLAIHDAWISARSRRT